MHGKNKYDGHIIYSIHNLASLILTSQLIGKLETESEDCVHLSLGYVEIILVAFNACVAAGALSHPGEKLVLARRDRLINTVDSATARSRIDDATTGIPILLPLALTLARNV